MAAGNEDEKNGSVNIPAVLCLQDPEGVESDRLDPDAVEDIYFIIKYQVSEKV